MTISTRGAAAPGARSPLEAIAIMCFASLCFIAMHTCIKSVRGSVPVPVILWSQYAFQIALLAAVLAPRRDGTMRHALSSPRLGLQVLRAVMLMSAVGLMFVAVGLMQLADAVAVTFVAPLLITAASMVFLKEKVSLGHWAAILVGFAGVLVIVRPGSGLFAWAALVPLAASVCVAVYQTLTRPLSATVAPLAMLFNATLTGALVTTLVVPFFWQMPDVREAGFLLAAGVFGTGAHFCLIKAYQWGQASLVAPFAYTELLWASLLGFTVFGDVPDMATLAGGAVIAASGLYLLRRRVPAQD